MHARARRSLVAAALLAAVPPVSSRAAAQGLEQAFLGAREILRASARPARPHGLPRLMRESGLPPEVLERIRALSDDIERRHSDPQERTTAFHEGMARLAKDIDPLAEFFTPQAYRKFLDGNEGFYGGIGALLARKEEGRPQGIDYPLPGSPAEKAGLSEGDEIVAVDGEDILPCRSRRWAGRSGGRRGRGWS